MLETFDFAKRRLETGVEVAFRTGGNGPPLLLLHGYPQTHAMWSRVAPLLTEKFTLVMSDLRGYGDSTKPPTTPDHSPYSFRAMAADQAALMTALGFETFMVAGHDRGGRTAHRLLLDQPERITRAAVLDIAPTLTMYERTDMAFAQGYYHWFFLTQPAPLPETLIGADPVFFLRRKFAGGAKVAPDRLHETFDSACLAEYERCFSDPATIHATCEDYRAAATIDLTHDRADRSAGRKIQCPLLTLWGEKGLVHRTYDVPAVWRQVSGCRVEGHSLPCGHYLPEEAPEQTAAHLMRFLTD